MRPDAVPEVSPSLSDDLLVSAAQIAKYLFGESSQRRKVYHLAAKGGLPVFRMGGHLCARRSIILAWITAQESEAKGRDNDRC